MSYHYGLGWCSNRECPCWKPGKPCSNFEGYHRKHGRFDKTDKETWPYRYCLCCGWERQDHRPLIHNGRKP